MEKELLELIQNLENATNKDINKLAHNILILTIITRELLYRICNENKDKLLEFNKHIEAIVDKYYVDYNDTTKQILKDSTKQFINKTEKTFL